MEKSWKIGLVYKTGRVVELCLGNKYTKEDAALVMEDAMGSFVTFISQGEAAMDNHLRLTLLSGGQAIIAFADLSGFYYLDKGE